MRRTGALGRVSIVAAGGDHRLGVEKEGIGGPIELGARGVPHCVRLDREEIAVD